MSTTNFRLNIVKKDGGENAGYIDVPADDVRDLKELTYHLAEELGSDKYLVIASRCPVHDNIEDKLDQIIELLKNRSKNE